MTLVIPSKYLRGNENDSHVLQIARRTANSKSAEKYLNDEQRRTLLNGTPNQMRQVLNGLYWRKLEVCRRYAVRQPQRLELSREDQTVIKRSTMRPHLTSEQHDELIYALEHLRVLLEPRSGNLRLLTGELAEAS